MYRILFPGLLLALLVVPVAAEAPASVMAETNLEKRSDLALKEADEAVSAVSKAYAGGMAPAVFEKQVQLIGELVQLSFKSLQDTGKQASRKPKYFKRAELKLRSLLRRLENLHNEVSAADRPPVEQVKTVIAETHDQLLHDIMAKKR